MNTLRELSLDGLSSDSMSSLRSLVLMDPINPRELSMDGGVGVCEVSVHERVRGGNQQ